MNRCVSHFTMFVNEFLGWGCTFVIRLLSHLAFRLLSSQALGYLCSYVLGYLLYYLLRYLCFYAPRYLCYYVVRYLSSHRRKFFSVEISNHYEQNQQDNENNNTNDQTNNKKRIVLLAFQDWWALGALGALGAFWAWWYLRTISRNSLLVRTANSRGTIVWYQKNSNWVTLVSAKRTRVFWYCAVWIAWVLGSQALEFALFQRTLVAGNILVQEI